MRVNGEKFGRWSLRLDAAYCVLLGSGVALFADQIAQGVALSPLLIAIVGVGVVVWAGGILWMLAKLPLWFALRLVMVANLLAAGAVGFVSIAAATVLIIAAVIAVAIDIALFATSQAIALRTLPVRS
ncbi:hypothetical protein [Paramicrobacterium agarici]|uniref:hypothetical protein n=1 Tax=Paramicrobacterium agarici TaxID=630514 RepID=UPI0011506EC3|nr:hypothetical protein [Microbacterium agarici]TQO22662.1 hypothetical protein FB385_1496 [Microbacterium agarici]